MKLKLKWIFLIAFLGRLIVAFFVWHPDLWNHMDWGERFFQYGAGGFFAPDANVWDYTWPNQPPGTVYLYALIFKLFGVVFQMFWWLNVKLPFFPSTLMLYFDDHLYPAMLKLPAILSDLGIAYVIYLIFKDWRKESLGKLGATLFLLNPVVWYNSTVWGQTDSVISLLAIVAFYSLLKKKLFWSMLALVVCFYVKVSLVVFAPVYLLIMIKLRLPVKSVIGGMVGVIAVIGALTLPFSDGEPFSWLYWLYTKKILGQQLQVITANAFNIWAALTGIHERPHTLMLGPLSYQRWGYLLFGGVYGWMLWWMARSQKKESVWWGLGLISFSSFMLLTNMHERYLFPLFPYLTILAVKHKKLMWILVTISVINLLNLYNFWWMPRIEIVVNFMSFGNRVMPRVLGLVSFVVFLRFAKYFVKEKLV